MNRGSAPAGGYTIVETLIFLAVSSALFISAMLLIGGRQNKAEFVNAVRDFETNLVDISNDVAVGYYKSVSNLPCTPKTNGPDLTSGTVAGLGEHEGCIFIGKVIKFGSVTTGNQQQYSVIGMVGNRTTPPSGVGATPVTNLKDSLPRMIAPSSAAYDTLSFGYNVTVEKVTYNIGGADLDAHAVGFFTTFQGSSLSDSGSRQTTVLPYSNVRFADINGPAVYKISNSTYSSAFGSPGTDYGSATLPLNPSGGVTICLKSGGTQQYALVKLGGGSTGSMTVSSVIKDISGASPLCSA